MQPSVHLQILALFQAHKSTQVVAQPWWINLRNYHHLGSLDNVYKAFFHMNPIISHVFPSTADAAPSMSCGPMFDILVPWDLTGRGLLINNFGFPKPIALQPET